MIAAEGGQHQLELAMERSVQDDRSTGSLLSLASSGNSSYRSRGSSPMSTNEKSISRTRSLSKSNSAVWKRNGKKWAKEPVGGSGDAGLLSIHEAEEQSFNASSPQSYQQLDHLTEDELEQEMIEEAMHRSMSALHNTSSDWHVSSPSRAPHYSSDASCSDSGSIYLDRQDAVERRLHELEQEKALLVQALHHGRSYADINEHVSLEGKTSPATTGLSAAGCHLEMIAAARGRQQTTSDARMMEQSGGGGPKLVWKRGPNGAWGRFPEDDGDQMTREDIQNREDALVAEALKRSMEDM